MRSGLVVCGMALVAGVVAATAQTKQATPPPAVRDAQAAERQAGQPLVQAVVTAFEGMLPCADCSGLRTTLTLSARAVGNPTTGTFTLKETYVGKNVTNNSAGRWAIVTGSAKDPNAVVYRLTLEKAAGEQYWLKVSDNELRALDRERREIDSPMPQVLKRVVPRPTPPTPPPGAYRPVAVGDAAVKAAATFAVAQQKAKAPDVTLVQVVQADSQVVAGTNYRLCLAVTRNGNPKTEPARAVVFRDLKDQMILKEWVWGGPCGK